MSRAIFLAVAAACLLLSCSGRNDAGAAEFRSMEQIHAEEGVPVRVREIVREPFSAVLKYPAVLRARSESAASAGLDDVVRRVNHSVGDYVEKDAVVLSFSPDNPAYRQARAAFENAEAAFRRSESLFADNGVSRQTYDNARAQYETALAVYTAADDMINVKAPISGHLTRLNVGETSNVEAGDPLFTVSNLDLMEARMWVSAAEIGRIKRGQAAEAEWLGRRVPGRVTRVNMIMDTDRKAFLVIADFGNPGKILTSGLTVDVSVETYRNDRAVVVSRKEILREGGGYHAFVAKDGIARRMNLDTGEERGFLLEVEKGLEPGDILIVEGAHLVDEGAKIRIVR